MKTSAAQCEQISDKPLWANPSLDWAINVMAATDRTGRVAQLAETCPGVLSMACRIIGPNCARLPGELLSLITSGARLGAIVDWIVNIWAESIGADETCTDAQRIRIVRAGPKVPVFVLWEEPAAAAIAEDIPRPPRENALWYLVLSEAARVARKLIAGYQRTQFFGFASRRAVEISEAANAFPVQATPEPTGSNPVDDLCDVTRLREALSQLADYLRHTGRTPGRRTNAGRLFAECARWHADGNFGSQKLPPEQTLNPGPTAGFSEWLGNGATVRFLATVQDLLDESSAMHHCVATYADRAVTGDIQLFHVDCDSEAVTVEISCDRGAPVLCQAKGVRNVTPSATALHAINAWLAELGTFVATQQKGARRTR